MRFRKFLTLIAFLMLSLLPIVSVTAATAQGFGAIMSVEQVIWALVAVAIGVGVALFIVSIIALIVPGVRKFFGGLV